MSKQQYLLLLISPVRRNRNASGTVWPCERESIVLTVNRAIPKTIPAVPVLLSALFSAPAFGQAPPYPSSPPHTLSRLRLTFPQPSWIA